MTLIPASFLSKDSAMDSRTPSAKSNDLILISVREQFSSGDVVECGCAFVQSTAR
jgi:hypothetical protein